MEISKQRLEIQDLIRHALKKNPKWESTDPDIRESIVRKIERSCYNNTIIECQKEFLCRDWNDPTFINKYSAWCYLFISNLDPDSMVKSISLSTKILNEEIDVTTIGSMTSYDMYPEASTDVRNTITVRQQQKVNQKVSTQLSCPKCREKKCSYFEIHTRGLDEPSDWHVTCHECQHEWRRR